ncbi:MAG TPA: Uma2 family endonuclease [Pyrinomonadaceae bacterium]|jgi:Uma2 family endonuclease|nr:Uma2 family endonuclease [Pyrinomonadaceae bacterium]
MSLQRARYFFTVAEFERMGEAGIFAKDAHLELIEGALYDMPVIGSRHAACVKFLSRFLNVAVGDKALVSTQNPIQLDDYSEPQPDVALLRLREDFYRHAHPTQIDVLLLIEVADTTVDYDRLVKVPLYAKAGIKEVWVVNLPAEQIEIYAEPSGDAYKITKQIKRGEEARAHTIPNLIVSADTVLE